MKEMSGGGHGIMDELMELLEESNLVTRRMR